MSKKEWLSPEQRELAASLHMHKQAEDLRRATAKTIKPAIKHLPAPNAISHGFTGPDPEREGQPTMYIVGGLDDVMQLARDLFVRDRNLTPEDSWRQANDFFNRAYAEAFRSAQEEAEAEAAAKAEEEPKTEIVTEGGIVLP